MPDFGDMNDFLRSKLRVPTMTTNDAPDGGDRQLQDAADELAAQANDLPYSPPLPVPIGRPEDVSDVRRQPASEVWLINPPAALPGLGNLVGGGVSEKGSQFSVNSIRIDNFTRQWLYFPEIGAWVPPLWYGRVLRSDGGKVQRVRFETPAGITALTLGTTEVARVMFSNDYWAEVDGEAVSAAQAGFSGAAGGVADYSTDANAVTLSGQNVNARLEGFTGTTYDRFRIPKVFKQLATSAIGAGSTVTVWTPASGLKPRLMGWVVTGSSGLVDAAVTFFETSTTGTFMGEVGFLAGIETPSYVNFMGGGPIVSTSSAVIVAFSSTGITLRGTLFGTEE